MSGVSEELAVIPLSCSCKKLRGDFQEVNEQSKMLIWKAFASRK